MVYPGSPGLGLRIEHAWISKNGSSVHSDPTALMRRLIRNFAGSIYLEGTFSDVVVSDIKWASAWQNECVKLAWDSQLGIRVLPNHNRYFTILYYYGINRIPKSILPLRKHAYSNILKILPPKNENFQIKFFWYFSYFCSKHRLWVLVRTIYVLSRNKKNNVYPYKPQFYYIKVGFKGVKII